MSSLRSKVPLSVMSVLIFTILSDQTMLMVRDGFSFLDLGSSLWFVLTFGFLCILVCVVGIRIVVLCVRFCGTLFDI